MSPSGGWTAVSHYFLERQGSLTYFNAAIGALCLIPLASSFFSKNNNFTRINFCSHTYHMIVKKLAPHFKRILYFTFSEYRISWY